MSCSCRMGASLARLMDVERTSWSKPHSLETNETYAGQQCEIIDKFFEVAITKHHHHTHHLQGG